MYYIKAIAYTQLGHIDNAMTAVKNAIEKGISLERFLARHTLNSSHARRSIRMELASAGEWFLRGYSLTGHVLFQWFGARPIDSIRSFVNYDCFSNRPQADPPARSSTVSSAIAAVVGSGTR